MNAPELTALLDAQRGEADPIRRREQVRAAVRLIHEKALQLALYSSPNYWFWQPHLKNYGPNFLGNGIVESWLDR